MNINDFNKYLQPRSLTTFEKALDNPNYQNTDELIKAARLTKKYKQCIYAFLAIILSSMIYHYI